MHQQKFSDALANFNPLRSPTAQPLHSPPAQPLHSVERNLCTAASATFALPPVLPLRFRERIYAGWRRHRGFPDASYGPAEEWRGHAKCRRESHPEESPRLFRPSEDLFPLDFIGSDGCLG